jgi:hypothetical protein
VKSGVGLVKTLSAFVLSRSGNHLNAEELLQVFELEFWSDPEQALPAEAAIRAEQVPVGVEAVRKIPKGLCGNNRRGDRSRFRHRGLQEGFQTFPGLSG